MTKQFTITMFVVSEIMPAISPLAKANARWTAGVLTVDDQFSPEFDLAISNYINVQSKVIAYREGGTPYNHVINPNMVINQRQVATHVQAVGVYGFDMWKGHAAGMEQLIPFLPAGTYTLTWTGGGNSSPAGGPFQQSPYVFAFPGGSMSIRMPTSARAITLNSGVFVSGVSTFEDSTFENDLVRCFPFYQKSYNYEYTAASGVTTFGAVLSRDGAATLLARQIPVSFTHKMKATPVVVVYTLYEGTVGNINLNNGAFTIVPVSLAAVGEKGFMIGYSDPGVTHTGAHFHWISRVEL